MRIFDPQSKILANFDYIQQLLERGSCPPILVEIDPSNVCNHGCDFCLSSYVHSGKQMLSEAAMLTLCDGIIASKTKAVNWTGGGEPTTNPSLKRAILKLAQASIKMGMFTNGTLLDRFDLFEIISSSLQWIRISVDAGCESTYNRIRHVNSDRGWHKMLSNLQTLIEVNNDLGHRLDIGVGFVITPSNVHEVIEFARVFKDYGVDYCQFKPEIVNIEREGNGQRRIAFWRLAEMLLSEARSILGDKFQVNQYKVDDLANNPQHFGRTYKKCLGSQVSPCVGADGLVYVCTNYRGHPKYSYGSIHERPFNEIWNDTERKLAVMSLIETTECFSACTKLCKPHESNKMLWKLFQDYQSAANKTAFIESNLKLAGEISIQHREFV